MELRSNGFKKVMCLIPCGGIIIGMVQQHLPPDFDHTPIEVFIQASLEKWRDFVTLIKATEQIYMVESFLFQNTIGMFLMGDAQPTRLKAYALEVQAIIKPLNPLLIYFYSNDIDQALHKICAVRGQAFKNDLLKNMESFPYMRHRGLKGLTGLRPTLAGNSALNRLAF